MNWTDFRLNVSELGLSRKHDKTRKQRNRQLKNALFHFSIKKQFSHKYTNSTFLSGNCQSTDEGSKLKRQWLYVCGSTSWLYFLSGLRGMTRNTSFSLVSLTHQGKGGAPQVLLHDFCRWRSCIRQKMHPDPGEHTVPVLRTKAKHKQRRRRQEKKTKHRICLSLKKITEIIKRRSDFCFTFRLYQLTVK